MEKSYRIHTNIIDDTVLNVNMQQDYDFLEVLSLKLRTTDAYRLHSSNYGVIIGRVLANDAFGIPNAKVSVFIERNENDPTYMESIYPFTEIMDSDREGRRYNLLPDYSDDDCYRIVGTFPNKRLVLDDNVNLEIYDKYWKFTTVTNNAGDYMIFGVPSGSQQVHVDIDLSDIGILSQTPRDFEHKGYNMSMFDSPKQFKESTNLDGLAQIFSQNKSVFVYPFWGDENLGNGIAAITRCDMQIQYKFEPTCVFMGAIISDNDGNSIGHKCAPNVDNGMNYQLVAGEGTIEMIRKTTDGLVEEYSIQGNQLIDSDGVWCYQIPMNLDFIATDEYGNIVPTDNPNKGIPTRAQVRFRFSKTETGDEGFSRHTAKYLVPMNPTLVGATPTTLENGAYIENMYTFGSSTPDDCFRDLYWNNVYSVKNYIPKVQVAHRAYAPNYTGLKGSNLAEDQNPTPFNKLRIDLPVVYVVVCIIFGIVRTVVQIINIIINVVNTIIYALMWLKDLCLDLGIIEICPFFFIPRINYLGCVSLGGGLSPDNTAYYPACDSRGMDAADCPDDMENCQKSANSSDLMDLVQQKLAEDYKIVKLDFYQDWVNGSLYMPLWYWRKRRKKKFLFWTISGAKNEFCDCDRAYSRLKSYVTCNISYTDRRLRVSDGSLYEGEDNWHRSSNRSGRVFITNGLIKGVENKDGLTAYYYAPIQPTGEAGDKKMSERAPFRAFRLFATDIILLGNLNEDNLYGLPQFFKTLPSTTANIPPIASVEEAADDRGGGTRTENTLLADEGEMGLSLVTGMDWLDGDGSPQYSDGLFMFLSCTYAHTKAKSCINVERLSELGMNLDMTYDAQYPSSSGLRYGTFEHDGFITKQELDDTDNRAMFATMNHLGFVPQSYQDSKKASFGTNAKFNETQVLDENTNYYVPKFKFLYPTDLDGRMEILLDRYANGFNQIMSDDWDEDYVNFRLGDLQGTTGLNGGQFYLADNSMPLYNNSFYFYFGVKKGNTAIDKFNKMFYAQCFKNSKKPFSLKITSQPKSYCTDIYDGDLGNSFIKVTSDDIQKPYSYRLLNRDGDVVTNSGQTIEGYNIMDDGFEIYGIDNESYVLRVTDANGRHVDERVNLSLDAISLSYTTRDLGTKFHSDEMYESSQKELICSDNEFYGRVTFDSIIIDGYEFDIDSGTTRLLSINSTANTDSSSANNKTYAIVSVGAKRISANTSVFSSETISSAATLYLSVDDTSTVSQDPISGCLCTNLDDTSFFSGITVSDDDGRSKFVFGFDVYRPDTYIATVKQMCKNNQGVPVPLSANVSTFSIQIENGEEFKAFLNKMPVKFLIDSGHRFYEPSPYNIDNWLEVDDENSYRFPKYEKLRTWRSYINLTNDITSPFNKLNVIKYKFSRMFDLSNGVFVTSSYGNKFQYTAIGGTQPLLYRSFVPNYADEEKVTKQFIYSDKNSVTMDASYPNIVGANYQDGKAMPNTWLPRINNLYSPSNQERLGNYFMVATNNGRYTDSITGDCSIRSYQIPDKAPVNIEYEWKTLGSKKKYTTVPDLVFSGGDALCESGSQPYFSAMFADRRIDFELGVIGPIMPNSIPSVLSDLKEEKKVTHTRFFGNIYGGIEMSYDNNYNIISANRYIETRQYEEDGETIIEELPITEKVTPNYSLEYTYTYGSGDTATASTGVNCVQTIRCQSHQSPYVWKDYGDKINRIIRNSTSFTESDYYDEEKSAMTRNQCVTKTYHTFTVNDMDVRQLLWSTEGSQKERLKRIVDDYELNNFGDGLSGKTLPFYLYDHSEDTDSEHAPISFYNNLFSLLTGNYPIKRYIDIGKITPEDTFSFNIASCNYELGIFQNDETKLLEATLNGGDNVGTIINFDAPVSPSPRDKDEDYGHFIYDIGVDENNHASGTYSVASIGLGINYEPNDYDGFVAQPLIPRLMTESKIVLFKNHTEHVGQDSMYNFWSGFTPMHNIMINGALGLYSRNDVHPDNTYATAPYSASDNYLTYNGRKLTLNDGYTQKCRAGLSWYNHVDHSNTDNYTYRQTSTSINFGSDKKFVTVCTCKELVPPSDEHLLKKIRVYEFSDFYDCRDIKLDFSAWLDNQHIKFEFKIYRDHEDDNLNQSLYNISEIYLEIYRQTDATAVGVVVDNFFYEEDKYFVRKTENGNLIITTSGPDLWNIGYREATSKSGYIYRPTDIIFMLTAENGIIYKFKFPFVLRD